MKCLGKAFVDRDGGDLLSIYSKHFLSFLPLSPLSILLLSSHFFSLWVIGNLAKLLCPFITVFLFLSFFSSFMDGQSFIIEELDHKSDNNRY